MNKTEVPPVGSAPPIKFADFHCDSIGLDLSASLEKFDIDRFSKPFEERLKGQPLPGVEVEAAFYTRNTSLTDYHVHLNWKITKSQIKLRVLYLGKAIKAEPDEEEPFAENVMGWLGGFFKANEALTHVHAAFEYPAGGRYSLAVPLPIKIPVGPGPEVEVDGMSLNLGTNDLGMNQAWLISREKYSRVLLYGDRSVEFRSFEILKEVALLSGLARAFLKEATTDETERH